MILCSVTNVNMVTRLLLLKVHMSADRKDDSKKNCSGCSVPAADQARPECALVPSRLLVKRRVFDGGDAEAAMAADVAKLTGFASQVLSTYEVKVSPDPKMVEEVVRYGGCELHTTSSVLGGITSQEVVKLVAKQYSPLCNTLILDGLHGKMQVLEV
eukprot:s1615_g5.t1